MRPPKIKGMTPLVKLIWNQEHSPFGSFLGISAAMLYRVKTDNLPLKITFKKTSQPLIGAKTMNLRPGKERVENERGLPV